MFPSGWHHNQRVKMGNLIRTGRPNGRQSSTECRRCVSRRIDPVNGPIVALWWPRTNRRSAETGARTDAAATQIIQQIQI